MLRVKVSLTLLAASVEYRVVLDIFFDFKLDTFRVRDQMSATIL